MLFLKMQKIILLILLCPSNVASFSTRKPPAHLPACRLQYSSPHQSSPKEIGIVSLNAIDSSAPEACPELTTSSSSLAVALAGIASTISWCTIAYVALSSHPVASVDAACGLRHNALTIAQALAFPVPVLWAVFATLCQSSSAGSKGYGQLTARRLYLGVATTSLWTAMAVFWGRTFSVGFDLFSDTIRYSCGAIHTITALVALSKWREAGTNDLSLLKSLSRIIHGCVGSFFSLLAPQGKSSVGIDDPRNDAALYSFASLGLLILAIMPQLVGFPTATIPTILGKRLSRPASGFTLLGAIAAYCLKDASEREKKISNNQAFNTLRRGLGIGSLGHLSLIVAKVVGVDGGGLILPGRGLWEFYPSLVGASGAATFLMILTYSILAFAALSQKQLSVNDA